jgi:predicted MPP superfamily phosphohydrolase
MNGPALAESLERPAGVAPELRRVPRRYSRARTALVELGYRVFERCGADAGYARRYLAPGRLRVRRERVGIAGLAPGLSGARIVQLSDIHAGPFVRRGALAGAIEAANALSPELVVLTGDYITRTSDEFELVAGDLARLRPRWGACAVLGNHDYRGRREGDLELCLARCGIELLRNQSRRFEAPGGAIAVVGLEDVEESRHLDLGAARAGVRPGDVEVLLCHNPGAAAALASLGCRLILSGHSHGHQVDLPLVRRLAPAHPGDRVELGASTLITSRGLGAVVLPLRIGSPAEIVCLELEVA